MRDKVPKTIIPDVILLHLRFGSHTYRKPE